MDLDINEASNSLAADILGTEPPADDLDSAIDKAADAGTGAETNDADLKLDTEAPEGDTATDAPAAPEKIALPQSWKKDLAPVWEKMDPAAQKYYLEREKQMLDGLTGYKSDAEYGRSLKGVIDRYQDVLQQQGIDATKAVEFLFAAHKNLSMGSPEQKMAYLARVAQSYGLTLNAQAPGQGQESATPLPPEVTALRDQVNRLTETMTARERADYTARQEQTAKDVDAFARDPANPYFDEVADDIVLLIKTGLPLKEAYEKAVWANPVTRQKEIGRIQTEAAEANRKKAQEAAQKAKKATAANVRGQDTARAPTGPKGTIQNVDEILNDTLADIRNRT